MTTHYLEEAEALADRVAVIDKARWSGSTRRRRWCGSSDASRSASGWRPPWTAGADALPEPLRRRGATLDASGDTVLCPVDGTPIADLLSLAGALSPAVVDVEIVQPSLEDVFLQLTKRPDAVSFTRRSP